MYEEWELTEEHYVIAEKNGISRANVKQRVESYGYDIQKAITKPLRTNDVWRRNKETCEQNGISYSAFYKRIEMGWSEERSSTEPIATGPTRQKERAKELRKELSPYWEQAEANGISFQVFRKRLAKGMSLEEAANRPKRLKGEWRP